VQSILGKKKDVLFLVDFSFLFSIGSAYNSDKFCFCHGVLEKPFFVTTWLDRGTLQQTAFVQLLYNSDNLTETSRYQDTLLFDLTAFLSFVVCVLNALAPSCTLCCCCRRL